MFAKFDVDGSGAIDFNEFTAMLVRTHTRAGCRSASSVPPWFDVCPSLCVFFHKNALGIDISYVLIVNTDAQQCGYAGD